MIRVWNSRTADQRDGENLAARHPVNVAPDRHIAKPPAIGP